jgi:hypothetical protein
VATGTARRCAMKRKQRKRLARELRRINATLQEIAATLTEVAIALSEQAAPEPGQPTESPRLQ